jgi:membrane protein YqaA with SNARE-associated domain
VFGRIDWRLGRIAAQRLGRIAAQRLGRKRVQRLGRIWVQRLGRTSAVASWNKSSGLAE